MSYEDYYQIYKDPILSQYLLCLNQSILVLLGSDIGPLTFNQVLFSSIGLFLGAVINANIFGELSLLISGLGKSEKEFQAILSSLNTAMINLELRKDLRQQIRNNHIRNWPSN